ncbi:predicted protein [Nematostella vectensis]|uniref:Glycolipid transfer protein domain-containing protein n=1 Tax=Nematostella vectensis TaxID=45351 RepID=A7S549_NEMVE|nr:glycolipid transfer protein [Nematostella vectensis]EDO41182.1 predicted protein [Nematostella vectensis]|eukprot:XP_001633245.1 predicted protein [Nematostella vectensis]
MSFFARAKHQFLPVPENRRIETAPFLDACGEVVPFFDLLGSTAFAPVKMDINGNITKLRKIYETDPARFKTLQDVVEKEIENKTTKAKNSGTDALLWLRRALHFIIAFLKEVLVGNSELAPCATKAYEKTLKKYHGFLVRGVFSLAMKAVPYRKDFMKALGGAEEEQYTVMEDIQNFVDVLDSNLDVLTEFYAENNCDDERKV